MWKQAGLSSAQESLGTVSYWIVRTFSSVATKTSESNTCCLLRRPGGHPRAKHIENQIERWI